jgi:Cu/Ag efflux protein CusF
LQDAEARLVNVIPNVKGETKMKKIVLVVAALVATAALPTLAQTPPVAGAMKATAPGKGVAANVVEITAVVEAIDKANRTVTLKGPKGNLNTVAAGPEVRNFDQIKVGDQVAVRYVEALSLELKKGGTAPVSRTEREASGTAKKGDKPAAEAGREVHVVANVVAVDAATKMVTLRGPRQTVDLKISDPEQLKLIKVGDQVEATYTEAVAISVEPAKK